jgi:hypothetical protein
MYLYYANTHEDTHIMETTLQAHVHMRTGTRTHAYMVFSQQTNSCVPMVVAHTYTCPYTYVYVYVYTYVCMHASMYVSMLCKYAYIYIYIHTCICIYNDHVASRLTCCPTVAGKFTVVGKFTVAGKFSAS